MASNIVAQMQVLISAQTQGLNVGLKDATASLNRFEKAAVGVGNTLKSFIGVGTVLAIGKEIVDVTAEFQKFQAVLTNTLGSSSAANKALENIRIFAKETPFEVSEVTAAYVRFANQGLNPSIDQMRKLGDVASSLGAGFEQTAEAFKDLAVGQTKRIEEIGISATQANGKIQLSFKGVNLEVEKNAAGVQKAIDTYSQLNGVLGTSDAVSKTLGGRISNLKDSFSNFFLTIGESSSGPLFDIITTLQGIVDISASVISSISNQSNAFGKFVRQIIDVNFGLAKATVGIVKFLASAAPLTVVELNAELTKLNKLRDEAIAKGDREQELLATKMIIELTNAYKLLKPAVEESNKAVEGTSVPVEQAIVSLDSLQLKLSELNKQFEATDVKDKKTLQNIGNNISAVNAQIAALESLRKKQEEVNLSSFGQKTLDAAQSGKKLDVATPELAAPTTSPFANLFPEDTEIQARGQVMIDTIAAVTEAYQLSTEQRQALAGIQAGLDEDEQRREQQKADMAQYVGSVIGQAFGDAVSSQKSALQATKQVLAKLLPMFLSMALAGTIAGAGKTTAPPPVILALAAAGVAAVSALFSKATGHSGGGGGGGGGLSQRSSTNVQRLGTTAAFGESVQFDATFRIQGNDLVAVANSQANRNTRLGG